MIIITRAIATVGASADLVVMQGNPLLHREKRPVRSANSVVISASGVVMSAGSPTKKRFRWCPRNETGCPGRGHW